jgi:hypothetical protein
VSGGTAFLEFTPEIFSSDPLSTAHAREPAFDPSRGSSAIEANTKSRGFLTRKFHYDK